MNTLARGAKVIKSFSGQLSCLFRHHDPEDDIGQDSRKSGTEYRNNKVKQPDQGNIPTEPFCEPPTNTGEDPVV
jgi:hypothetical protein